MKLLSYCASSILHVCEAQTVVFSKSPHSDININCIFTRLKYIIYRHHSSC